MGGVGRLTADGSTESSRRGLLTLRSPAGEVEHIRTEQQETDRGRELIARAQSMRGRWVLVFRYNEKASATRNVRMLAHLLDLGDGAVAVNLAKKILLDDADGAVPRAQAAWAQTDLPDSGTVSVEQLEQARAKLKDA
ncbi:hypothetical protein AB0C59_32325 [Streptomyces sp. NPDC048664]|uniref:hypothetical protein n=1 Tax=Streptomyces sp. NPDC048664 TaxID=3154505 RepID=UPI00342BEFA4